MASSNQTASAVQARQKWPGEHAPGQGKAPREQPDAASIIFLSFE